jgi:hypothetical protein
MMLRMKQWSRAAWATLVGCVLTAPLAFAQDAPGGSSGGGTVTTQTTSEVWYGNWWVWAIGIAVFLIIVIALTNRGGRSTGA